MNAIKVVRMTDPHLRCPYNTSIALGMVWKQASPGRRTFSEARTTRPLQRQQRIHLRSTGRT